MSAQGALPDGADDLGEGWDLTPCWPDPRDLYDGHPSQMEAEDDQREDRATERLAETRTTHRRNTSDPHHQPERHHP